MDGNIKLNAQTILEKAFTPNGKGYDPAEVDDFLDEIIADYLAFERYLKDSRDYIVDLETSTRKYQNEIAALELENAKMKRKLSGIKDADNVSNENIELLNRISRLENALYNAGIDPTKL